MGLTWEEKVASMQARKGMADQDAAELAQGPETEEAPAPINIDQASTDTIAASTAMADEQATGIPSSPEPLLPPEVPEEPVEAPTDRAARVALQSQLEAGGPIEMQAPQAPPGQELTAGQQQVATDNADVATDRADTALLAETPTFQAVVQMLGGDLEGDAAMVRMALDGRPPLEQTRILQLLLHGGRQSLGAAGSAWPRGGEFRAARYEEAGVRPDYSGQTLAQLGETYEERQAALPEAPPSVGERVRAALQRDAAERLRRRGGGGVHVPAGGE